MPGNRVLIVDDALVMRMMIRGILGKHGYDVVGEARGGAEAVERYRSLAPDLVTMDLVMPGMDGLAALKAIVASDPHACVVMCAAMGQQMQVAEAIQAGAKSIITKPFQPHQMLEAIEKALA